MSRYIGKIPFVLVVSKLFWPYAAQLGINRNDSYAPHPRVTCIGTHY